MTFVRAKEIPPHSGNWYDYEVRTVHEGKRVIQKFVRYIGKVGSNPRPILTGDTAHPSTSIHAEISVTPVNQVNPFHPVSEVVTCKYCQSEHVSKYGAVKGVQRYWCKDCHHKFVNNGAITKMKTPTREIASAVGMYYRGLTLDGIQGQFKQDYNLDMSESNYWNWIKRFTREAIKQSKDFKPEVGDRWVADETYMKLGDRTVYFWDIIDVKTRYLLATHASFNRGAKDARELMQLAEQRAGKAPKTIVTDKLASYISGVEDTFGADAKHLRGGPFKTGANIESNTNEIERFHETLELRTRVFHKYDNIRDIKLLTDGWLIYYNFFKQNEGVGDIPPAQTMSKTVPFKDWNDIIRNKEAIPETGYKVTLHPRPIPNNKARKNPPIRKVDVTLTPLAEHNNESA